MPRGVRRNKIEKTLDEQIADVDLLIMEHQNGLKSAKEKRSALLKQKEEADAKAIIDAIKASGKTTDEILNLIIKADATPA